LAISIDEYSEQLDETFRILGVVQPVAPIE
jgi:hypothetical protein